MQVFLHVFGGLLPASFHARHHAPAVAVDEDLAACHRALLGVRALELPWEKANEIFSPFLPNWNKLRSYDGFVAEVVQDCAMSFKFGLQICQDFDHSACMKCSHLPSFADIMAGVAPTECSSTRRLVKNVTTPFTLQFSRRRKNGSAFRDFLDSSSKK